MTAPVNCELCNKPLGELRPYQAGQYRIGDDLYWAHTFCAALVVDLESEA